MSLEAGGASEEDSTYDFPIGMKFIRRYTELSMNYWKADMKLIELILREYILSPIIFFMLYRLNVWSQFHLMESDDVGLNNAHAKPSGETGSHVLETPFYVIQFSFKLTQTLSWIDFGLPCSTIQYNDVFHPFNDNSIIIYRFIVIAIISPDVTW